MNTNEDLIRHFYTCFKDKDIKGIQSCYADQATFNDPIFKDLNADEVRSMWEMLLKNGKDMRIEFKHVEADELTGSAEWTAYYTFSATGNRVTNNIKAFFIFENGKIIQHQDDFNFYNWAKQALGLTGWLLGWTPFVRNKIRKKAAHNLSSYMAAQISHQDSK